MPTTSAIEYRNTKSDVVVTSLKSKGLVDGDIDIKCKCSFCGKQVKVLNHKKILNDTITGNKGFHCGFCIKNNYYNRQKKDILIMSFRGVIGYYYYCLYRNTPTLMYLSELQDHIDLHEEIGNSNPVFTYDKDSFCWFIDFAKIGKRDRQLRLKHVLDTTLEILASFNTYKYYPDFKGYELYVKYRDAILEFFQKRIRPSDKKVLSPTLFKCNIDFKTETKAVFEDTRNFTPEHMFLCDKFKI